MCFFRKKKDTKNTTRKDILEDTNLISANTVAMDGLLVLASTNVELQDKLAKLQDKIKYLNPSVNDKVIKIDEKIGNAIGDLKIALNKSSEDSEKVEKLFKDIEMLIVDRERANIE